MAKEKRKIRRSYFIGGAVLALSIAILIGTLFFTKDIFINRTYLAGKAFENAFTARITGNCEGFMRYVLTDRDNWANKCDNEKTLHTDPFYDFDIRKITVEGDQAFIQVELTRGALKDKYPVTYQMKLKNGNWLIDQNSFQ